MVISFHFIFPNTMDLCVCDCGATVEYMYDDTTSGDTVCTLCGNVLDRSNSLVVSPEHITLLTSPKSVIPTHKPIQRVVDDMDLEPAWEWQQSIYHMFKETSFKITLPNVCGVVAYLFKERSIPIDRVFVHAQRRYNLSAKKVLRQSEVFGDLAVWRFPQADFDIDNVYVQLVQRLSDLVKIKRADITILVKTINNTLENHPELEFKMPSSVVVAVYFRWVSELGGSDLLSESEQNAIYKWMNIGSVAVKKISKLLI